MEAQILVNPQNYQHLGAFGHAKSSPFLISLQLGIKKSHLQ